MRNAVRRMWETGSVPEYCTCGAQLPPDALFCHKCGKPQRDLIGAEPEESLPPTVPQTLAAEVPSQKAPPQKSPPVGFRNPIAVRVALLTGIGALLFNFLP